MHSAQIDYGVKLLLCRHDLAAHVRQAGALIACCVTTGRHCFEIYAPPLDSCAQLYVLT